ncbi:MAG: YgjV family protein [Oscillospiraceae bacterium]|jgi:hypothetical protein
MDFYIELLGYIGSAIVLVSFLLTSVVKLRIVNSIGGFIFAIYALIIKSYPTAIMNFALVVINIYYLIKMSRTDKAYDLVEVSPSDTYLKHELERCRSDILSFFPGTDLDPSHANSAYIVCQGGETAGLMLGNREGSTMDLVLDYTTEKYRDFSVGKYVFGKLGKSGIKQVTFSGPDEKHKKYLDSVGFKKEGDRYVKNLEA